jgi:hypothetical protein
MGLILAITQVIQMTNTQVKSASVANDWINLLNQIRLIAYNPRQCYWMFATRTVPGSIGASTTLISLPRIAPMTALGVYGTPDLLVASGQPVGSNFYTSILQLRSTPSNVTKTIFGQPASAPNGDPAGTPVNILIDDVELFIRAEKRQLNGQPLPGASNTVESSSEKGTSIQFQIRRLASSPTVIDSCVGSTNYSAQACAELGGDWDTSNAANPRCRLSNVYLGHGAQFSNANSGTGQRIQIEGAHGTRAANDAAIGVAGVNGNPSAVWINAGNDAADQIQLRSGGGGTAIANFGGTSSIVYTPFQVGTLPSGYADFNLYGSQFGYVDTYLGMNAITYGLYPSPYGLYVNGRISAVGGTSSATGGGSVSATGYITAGRDITAGWDFYAPAGAAYIDWDVLAGWDVYAGRNSSYGITGGNVYAEMSGSSYGDIYAGDDMFAGDDINAGDRVNANRVYTNQLYVNNNSNSSNVPHKCYWYWTSTSWSGGCSGMSELLVKTAACPGSQMIATGGGCGIGPSDFYINESRPTSLPGAYPQDPPVNSWTCWWKTRTGSPICPPFTMYAHVMCCYY